jgi:hypothetical protein
LPRDKSKHDRDKLTQLPQAGQAAVGIARLGGHLCVATAVAADADVCRSWKAGLRIHRWVGVVAPAATPLRDHRSALSRDRRSDPLPRCARDWFAAVGTGALA